MLESPLLLYYAPNNIISLISEFSLCYEKLLDEFKMVSNDDFIRVGIDENLEFVISENIQSPYDTYNIFRNIDDNRHSIYVANYPLFDENMLKGLYRISGTKAEILEHQIFQLYSIVNRWERTCQNKLDVDKLMIASGRLCKKAYINFYSKNNISFDLQWS
ncbi:hypothetical protein SDC9_199352 [bioreactor metagenome]|uniref:Uncharacterized protein n=1 Tax=bioreactor metagenome TaxID=1076179 RepID=A0A645IWZ1_9ZZZZ